MYNQVETIYGAIEYIESHLQRDVSVAQIAESVGYSLFHFIRTFNRVVHHTPYDYLIRRRLTEAARVLATSDRRIADISQDFCFENQECFSRAFKRLFDRPPSQWREDRLEIIPLLTPPKIFADLQFINREDFQYPVLEEFPETTLRGLMTALDANHPTQQKQRSRVIADLCGLCSGSSSHPFVEITSYTDRNWKNAYYFAGMEEKAFVFPYPALVTQMLPAGRYVRMDMPPDERTLALNYLHYTWFPKTGLKPARQMEIEFCSHPKDRSVNATLVIPVSVAEDSANPKEPK